MVNILNPITTLDVFPGQTKTSQFINPDQSDYAIPTGSTIEAKLLNGIGRDLGSLSPIIIDYNRGLFRLTFPDNSNVRRYLWQVCTFLVILTTPTQARYEKVRSVVINDDYRNALAPNSGIIINYNSANNGSSSANPGSTSSTTVFQILDQIWQDQHGNKVQMVIEKQPNQEQRVKLTEIQ